MAEKKGLIAEFKEFIMQGNVMDLAVGVVIGAAFTAIVNSLVSSTRLLKTSSTRSSVSLAATRSLTEPPPCPTRSQTASP